MIGGALLGAWTVFILGWMAYDETPRWVRVWLQWIIWVAAFTAVGVTAFWAWDGLSNTR